MKNLKFIKALEYIVKNIFSTQMPEEGEEKNEEILSEKPIKRDEPENGFQLFGLDTIFAI